MTNKELKKLAENCGFRISDVHHAFYESENQYTEFARQIASICVKIAEQTNSDIALQIKQEFGL